MGVMELFHFYREDKAEALLQEGVRYFQMVDDPAPQVMIIKTLGYLLLVRGDFEETLALKRHELEINQEIGDRRMTGITQAEVGEVLSHLGRYAEAEEQIRAGIALLQGKSDYEIALRHRYLGDVLLAQGKNEEALEVYRLSYQFFQSRNEKGWMLTALTGLSRAELALENRPSAWAFAHQALRCYSEVQMFTFFAYQTIAEIALLLADQGNVVRALELYGLVLQQGHLRKSHWFTDVYGKFIEEASVQIPMEEQVAAKKRGREIGFGGAIKLFDSIWSD
jgi:tetratricopeptide (TPR) repeat protein